MLKAFIAAALLILVGWLFVPAISSTTPPATNQEAFVWDQDAVWGRLEQEFNTSREDGCIATTPRIDRGLQALTENVEWLERGSHAASDARLPPVGTTIQEIFHTSRHCTLQVHLFQDANAYTPPYWQLVAMARKTLAEAEG